MSRIALITQMADWGTAKAKTSLLRLCRVVTKSYEVNFVLAGAVKKPSPSKTSMICSMPSRPVERSSSIKLAFFSSMSLRFFVLCCKDNVFGWYFRFTTRFSSIFPFIFPISLHGSAQSRHLSGNPCAFFVGSLPQKALLFLLFSFVLLLNFTAHRYSSFQDIR